MRKRWFVTLGLISCAALACLDSPAPTSLSLRVQQPFHEVVKDSSFPVMASSNIPDASTDGSGATWVTEPAVVIHFNDAEHGFTLPPTTFAAVSYSDYRVITIDTSPMLKKLSFGETLEIVDSLQRQFQAKGWQLAHGAKWIDLSDSGKSTLRAVLREHGHWISIRVPKKYYMFFGLHCFERCDSRIGLDRYLIDISIGRDIELNEENTKTN
ncbi:hypothetical protein GJ698_14125 [Pseudoduganella sp. FT26W]|uniref:Lipoprotein n=1 Tax=Duganella aquatilis TaxID=2666082 RepID=A0A844D2P6_9BURK|nr:hypothetical protein [Duganella aquatilis]MRW85221.1 hypothetical protein [Duganella aquatilis]